MKKIILLLTGFLLIGSSGIDANEVEINLTIKFNGAYKPDSVYILLYPVTDKVQGEPLPRPLIDLTLTELSASFKIDPGTYYFGVMALGYKTLMLPLIIPPEKDDYEMNITLNPQIIGWGGISNVSDIYKVTVRGDYNLFRENNEIPMIKYGSVWKLNKESILLEDGKRYAFYVNGQETIDLLNPEVTPAFQWLTLKSVYRKNELVFDPAKYSLEYKESELNVPWRELQNQYTKIVKDVTQTTSEWQGVLNGSSNISQDAIKSLYQSTLNNLIETENNNDSYYKQFFLFKQLDILIQKNLLLSSGEPIGTKNITPLTKATYRSEEFKNSVTEIVDILNQLDPTSVFQRGLDILDITTLANFDNFITAFPDLAIDMDLEKNHFLNFIKDYTGKMKNSRLVVQILFDYITVTGFYLAYDLIGEEERSQTLKLLDLLKSNYPYEKYIPAEDMNTIMELLNSKP